MKSLLIPILAFVFFVLTTGAGQSQEAKPLVLDAVGKISNDTKRNCAACHQVANEVDELVGDFCPAMVQQLANQMANLEAMIAEAQSSRAVANAAQSRAATWLRATQAQLSTAERVRVAEVAEQDLAKTEVDEHRSRALAAVKLAEGQHVQALAAYHAALAKHSQLNDYVVQLLDARGNAALQEYALKALDSFNDNAAGSQDEASLYWIGVQCEPAGEITVRIEPDSENMLTVKGGLRVNAVTAESPAQAAGVQELDVILFMNDKPTNQIEDLAAIVNENEENVATLSVVRDSSAIKLNVTPAKRPQANTEEANYHLNLKVREMPLLLPQYYGVSGIGAPMPELPDGFEATLRFNPGSQPEFTIRQGEQSWDVKHESISQIPEAAQPFARFVLQALVSANEGLNPVGVNGWCHRWLYSQALDKYAFPMLNEVPVLAKRSRLDLNSIFEQPATLEINNKLDQVQEQLNDLRELIEAMKK